MSGRPLTLATAACAVLAAVLLGAPAPSRAASIVGEQVLTANEGAPALTGQNIPVFQGASSGGYALTSAQSGVITSWSFMSAGVEHGTPYVLRVLAPAGGSSWRAAATSKPVTVTSETGTDEANGPFPDSIPIVAGDAIAIQPTNADGNTPIEQGVLGADGIRFFTAPFGDGATAELAPESEANSGQVVPVQAIVEPPPEPPSKLAITLYGEGTGEVYDDHGHTCFKTTAATTPCPITSWAPGTVVTLHGAGSSGSSFDGFLGPGCSITPTCSLRMTGDQTVSALMHRPQEIGVTLAGTGYGSVSAASPKIYCAKPAGSSGAFCPFYVPWNTAVSLNATPDPGSAFVGWSGGCSGTGECFLDTAFGTQMTTANFAPAGEVHVNAIEVTQGVQTPELPTRTSAAGFHVSYRGVPLPWSGGAPVTVKLVEGHATVVRVYANTSSPLAAGSPPPMRLTAMRGGRVLAPGPIGPDKPPSPGALPVGALGSVGAGQRFSRSGAYTFTLPGEWAHGDISLQADANPDPNALANGCSDPACKDRGIVLDAVHFNAVRTTTINPVAFVAGLRGPKGYPGPDPQWGTLESALPVPLQVNPYVETVSANGTLSRCAGLEQEKGESNEAFAGRVYRQRASELLQSVNEWEFVNYVRIGYPMGLASSEVPNTCSNANGFSGGTTGGGGSVATDNRPLTAMAHELSHGIGRTHAGVECGSGEDATADEAKGVEPPDKGDDGLNGGQKGETWPELVGGTNFVGGAAQNTFIDSANVQADGALDGVGLAGMEDPAKSPYELRYNPTLPSPAGEFYDLMSYCGGDARAWTSVRNWNRDVEYAEGVPVDVTGPIGFPGSFYGRQTPVASVSSARSLAVSVMYDLAGGRALAMTVTPDAAAPTAASASGYSLTARDAAGHALASAGAAAYPVHIDGSSPEVFIVGRVPLAGTRAVEALQEGRTIALDRASAHAPTATLLSPRGALARGAHGTAVIRWRSRDADGGALKALLRYSADGGRTWRTVFSGPDQGSAVLPAAMLAASRRARIRLYTSDGFNEAIATSQTFVSPGAPPEVTITSPGAGLRAAAGSAISLTGSAFDDAGSRLAGRSLTWRSGRLLLGRGASTSTVALPAGRHAITLTARDRSGRTATASVSVTVLPSVPVLRLLGVPRRLSPRASSVGIRLATLAPATLAVAGRRMLVGRATSSVRLPVSPGGRPLVLALVLRSGAFTSRVSVTIAR